MIDRGGSSKPNYQPNDSHTLKKTASTKSSAGTKKNTKSTSSGTKKKTKTTKVVTKTTKSNKSNKSKTTKSNKSNKSKATMTSKSNKSKITKTNKSNVVSADALDASKIGDKVKIETAKPIDATSLEELGAIPVDTTTTYTATPTTSPTSSSSYSTGAGSITGPTFVGMNANNVPQFHKAVDVYRDKIQSIIDRMVITPNTEGAFKGAVASAALEYLAAAKELLNKYVTAIDIEKEEIDKAQAEWEARAGEIAKEVISDSDDIRSQSGGIVLD